MCQLKADRTLLDNDPCPGFIKQLFVQYQCLENYALNSTIEKCDDGLDIPLICPALSGRMHQTVACDKSLFNISCGNNTNYFNESSVSKSRIKIECGFYGSHPILEGACEIGNGIVPVFYFDRSIEYVKKMCDGKSECELSVGSADWVSGVGLDVSGFMIKKALYVQWWCHDGL